MEILEAERAGARAHVAAAGPFPICQADLPFPTVNSNLIRPVPPEEGNLPFEHLFDLEARARSEIQPVRT